ncbi:MAG: hypothetical protein JO112_14200, partial [Planctomycetes bacterium]|nr:hypothetical protein [Planctomycetota bacterium]
HHVHRGDPLWWWQCADIKVDAPEGTPPTYQRKWAEVDYVTFESALEHRDLQAGRVNRIFVQLHNRGSQPAQDVRVLLLWTEAAAAVPDLPADFWTNFPKAPASSAWTPAGETQTIPVLSPTEPVILPWALIGAPGVDNDLCFLVVADCASDPIPAEHKVRNIKSLIQKDKRVGLKNVHVVQASARDPHWVPFSLWGDAGQNYLLRVSPTAARGWTLGVLFPKNAVAQLQASGMEPVPLTGALENALRDRIGSDIQQFDTSRLFRVSDGAQGGSLAGLTLPEGRLRIMMLFQFASPEAVGGSVSLLQEMGGEVVGGSTFVLRQEGS